MWTRTHVVLALALAPSLVAQSNAVPGTDVQIYELFGITASYRRGPAYPNGEAGVVIGHSHCNAGSVNVPWVSVGQGGQMLDTYPKIAFLLARDTGERIEQISGRSFAKHSGTPFNFGSGPCAPCMGGAGGGFFFVGCSDTYGTGFNGSRSALGPTTEINPWLGSFNAIGSYFDRGDPSVGGAAAMDGIRSLSSTMTSQFDAVKNRMEVSESDLTPGGPFFAQAYVVIKGEPVGNRANNMRSQEASIDWGGSFWNASLVGASRAGSVLTNWDGATLAENGNGSDDGRFLVAVKVTGPDAGMYHYEYAVHNLDNSRAGATFRVPLAAGATVGGFGSHDVDHDPTNDWSSARVGNEIVYSAPASNPHEWNTIYNFWFDCDESPSFGQVGIDQARPGPGAMTVFVDAQVPSGVPTANITPVGAGCGDCLSAFYEYYPDGPSFDLANTGMQLTRNAALGYDVTPSAKTYVFPTGTDLTLAVNSETNVALPFSLPYPGGTTTSLIACTNGFISPAASNGTSQLANVGAFLGGAARWSACWHNYDPPANGRINVMTSPTEVRITYRNLVPTFGGGQDNFQYVFEPNGTVHFLYRGMTADGFGKLVGWTPGSAVDPGPSDLSVAAPAGFTLCESDVTHLSLRLTDRPVLGTSIQFVTEHIAPGTTHGVVMLSFTRHLPPVDLGFVGMPGCPLYGAGNGVLFPFSNPSSTERTTFAVPNAAWLTGMTVVSQSFTVSPLLNQLGVLASNGFVLKFGT
ncbi:MAG: hypothetical protein KDB80_00595 [Planctomycetes bacterium]|nr:hypothetical protein [Planctomycetota bacterium]